MDHLLDNIAHRKSKLQGEIIKCSHSVALTKDGDFEQVEDYVHVPVSKVREWMDRYADIIVAEIAYAQLSVAFDEESN